MKGERTTNGAGAGLGILLISLFFMIFPGHAGVIGLGKLTIGSRLGDTIHLWLDVIAPGRASVSGFEAKLAPASVFEQEGIPYDPRLAAFRVSVETHAGRPYRIHLRGPAPTTEALSMLLEVRWSNGRLLREIEVPPQPSAPGAVPRAPIAETTPQPVAKPSPPGGPRRAKGGQRTEPPPRPRPGGRYVVQRGDTLLGIVQRMGVRNPEAVARRILEVNPQAFIGGDMNRLLAGAVLRLDLATGEPRAPRPASPAKRPATPPTPAAPELETDFAPADRQAPPFDEPTADLDNTVDPADPEPPAEQPARLRILAAAEEDAPASGAVPQDPHSGTTAEALELAQELAESRRREAESLRQRVQQLEQLVAHQERLIALQSDELTRLQERLKRVQGQQPAPQTRGSPWMLWTALLAGVLALGTTLVLIGLSWRARRYREATQRVRSGW